MHYLWVQIFFGSSFVLSYTVVDINYNSSLPIFYNILVSTSRIIAWSGISFVEFE